MSESRDGDRGDFPLAESGAAVMLREGLLQARLERGLSARKIGAALGYKTSVVLSHMASGRVPIPLERAKAIAEAVGIDPSAFLLASLAQKEPGAVELLRPASIADGYIDPFMAELLALAGHPLDKLPEEHKQVLREVVTDRTPRRRWLALAEIAAVVAIRETVPDFPSRGLDGAELNALRAILDP